MNQFKITRSYISFLLLISLFLITACSKKNELLDPPVQLRTEYQVQPLNVNETNPQISWQYKDKTRWGKQGAYQVLVATSEEKLNEEEADAWNTGKVRSDESVNIIYDGKPLISNKRYYWKVQTWNSQDQESGFSETTWFETAFLEEKGWNAKWISLPAENKPPHAIAVRKEFRLANDIKKAKVFVTGLGSYVMFINGSRVDNDRLTPGWTHYPEKVQYQVYNVTDLIKSGDNAVGAYLGNVWWSSGLGWEGGTSYSDGPLKFMAQLEITYENGSKEIIVTDGSWQGNEAPIRENTLYDGEVYDARLEQIGWDEANFNQSGWQSVMEMDHPDSIRLVAQEAPAIEVTEELEPVAINEVKPGVYVFDMGQNMVGIARLKVQGEAGTEVSMKFAELVHPDGTVAQENLRSIRPTDRYILKGDGVEVWESYFTYHGFRYVQVEGLSTPPTKEII